MLRRGRLDENAYVGNMACLHGGPTDRADFTLPNHKFSTTIISVRCLEGRQSSHVRCSRVQFLPSSKMAACYFMPRLIDHLPIAALARSLAANKLAARLDLDVGSFRQRHDGALFELVLEDAVFS